MCLQSNTYAHRLPVRWPDRTVYSVVSEGFNCATWMHNLCLGLYALGNLKFSHRVPCNWPQLSTIYYRVDLAKRGAELWDSGLNIGYKEGSCPNWRMLCQTHNLHSQYIHEDVALVQWEINTDQEPIYNGHSLVGVYGDPGRHARDIARGRIELCNRICKPLLRSLGVGFRGAWKVGFVFQFMPEKRPVLREVRPCLGDFLKAPDRSRHEAAAYRRTWMWSHIQVLWRLRSAPLSANDATRAIKLLSEATHNHIRLLHVNRSSSSFLFLFRFDILVDGYISLGRNSVH